MQAALSHISSARFWEAFGSADLPLVHMECIEEEVEPPTAHVLDTIRALGVLPDEESIHALSTSQASRRRLRGIVSHSCSRDLPSGACLRHPSGVCVCSPEFTFVQMANILSVEQLVYFGMMLCGIYARDVTAVETVDSADVLARPRPLRHLRNREPLTTIDGLESFLNAAGPIDGTKRARRAIGFIMERSRSPMESVASLVLSLPHRLGGYAFAQPHLNFPVYIDAVVSPIGSLQRSSVRSAYLGPYRYDEFGRPYLLCDMVWPDASTVVEYLGGPDHTGQQNVHKDSVRSNILGACGVNVLTLTKETLFNHVRLNDFVDQLSRHIGSYPRVRIDDFERRTYELLRGLTTFYPLW